MKPQSVVYKGIILSCMLFLASPLFAFDSTDVIVMKNGDRLTGEIKSLSAGVLYVNMDYILGTSSVQWSKVASLESKQLFVVKTEDGSVYTGTLSGTNAPGGRPMELAIAETSEKAVIESPKVVQDAANLDEVLPAIQRRVSIRELSTRKATNQRSTT